MNRNSRFPVFLGLALVLLGILFFVGQFLGVDAWALFWPVLLILIGVFFILGRPIFSHKDGVPAQSTMKVVDSVAQPVAAGSQPVEQLSSFTRMVNKGVGSIIITQGEPEEVRVEAVEEIKQRLRLDVKDDTLTIRIDADWVDWVTMPWFHSDTVRFYITMKTIKSINQSGAGSITAQKIDADQLDLVQSGAGNLKIETLKAQSLNIQLSGAGSIDLAGQAVDQKVDLSGAGSYNAFDLESQSARVRLSGVGSAHLWVTQNLNAELSGVGSVEYYGSPVASKKISGVGGLKSLGSK